MIFQSDEVKLTKKVNFVFYGFILLKEILFIKGDTIRPSIFLFIKNTIFRATKKLFYQN